MGKSHSYQPPPVVPPGFVELNYALHWCFLCLARLKDFSFLDLRELREISINEFMDEMRSNHIIMRHIRSQLYVGSVVSWSLNESKGITTVHSKFWITGKADAALDTGIIEGSYNPDFQGYILFKWPEFMISMVSSLQGYEIAEWAQDAGFGDAELASDVPALSPPYSRPGRRPEYDAEAFLIKAMRIVFYDGPPETQAELVRRTCAAYVAADHKGGEPSEDWAKRKIAKLWKGLDLGEE
jgi:hypothetical protein